MPTIPIYKTQILAMKMMIFMLGFSAVIMQLLFIRELYAFFYANELILGVILSVWMLFVALGSWLGRFFTNYVNKTNILSAIFLILAVVPPLIIILLRFYRINFFFPGLAVDMPAILLTCLVFLSVYCLLSGLAFTSLCSIYSSFLTSNKINEVYYRETIGSVVGGLLFSFIFVFYFSTFQILNILVVTNLLVIGIWAFTIKLRPLIIVVFLFIAASNLLWLFDLDNLTKKDFFINQKIIEDIDTPYGNITITDMDGQHNLFYNGLLMYSDNDVIRAEEKVHLTMLQKKNISNVLLISGSISGTINELLKYDNIAIDYVDFNPYLIDIAKRYKLIPETGINVIIQDPVMFLRSTEKKYDVIIADIPDPLNAQLNRYYSLEFFNTVSQRLENSGVFSIGLSSSGQYLNDYARQLHAVLYKTMCQVFEHVLILPAGQNYFIASQHGLSMKYANLYEQRNIDTEYVNPYYIDDSDLEIRSKRLKNELDMDVKINKDYFPSAYLIQNKYWMSQNNHNLWFLYVFIIVMIVFMILRFNSLNFCLFTAGLAGTGIEVIIMIVFQIIYGYVYGYMGFIIALFMAGLALGAYACNRIKINNKVVMLAVFQWIIALMAALLPLLIIFLNHIDLTLISQLSIFTFTLLFAVFIGAAFAMTVAIYKVNETKAASVLYSADMLGAALGGILFSCFLIPLLGIYNSCFIITFVNILSGFLIFVKRKNYI